MAPLRLVHTVFTDQPPEPAFERLLRDIDVRCVVAPAEPGKETQT